MADHLIKGLEITMPGAPRQHIEVGNSVSRIAVFASDYPGVVPSLHVAEGDRLKRGDPLFSDRTRPEIQVSTPIAGKVVRIVNGANQKLSLVEIEREGEAAKRFVSPKAGARDDIAKLCLETGLWAAFLERPFGRIPDPGSVPMAIFVTALDSDPLCADATVILSRHSEAFRTGVRALKSLTDGTVFVCQRRGDDAVDSDEQIRVERFEGPHPTGLPGTHIDRLLPPGAVGLVWQIHYQDVIALGMVLKTGTLSGTRVTALCGPGISTPRLIEIPQGAALKEVLHGEIGEGRFTTLSGSPISGQESSHLRRHHRQISVLPQTQPKKLAKGWWARIVAPSRNTAVIPTRALERALGPNIAVVPLIRALSAGDVESADQLGCRALLEEDLALATYVSGGSSDFGALLRHTLDKIEHDE